MTKTDLLTDEYYPAEGAEEGIRHIMADLDRILYIQEQKIKYIEEAVGLKNSNADPVRARVKRITRAMHELNQAILDGRKAY